MEQNKLIEQLYVGPNKELDSKAKNRNKLRPKELKTETEDTKNPHPTFPAKTVGNVIMQNWNTTMTIPKDIGHCLNLPIIVDRRKLQSNFNKTLFLPQTSQDFTAARIREAGERLIFKQSTKKRPQLAPTDIEPPQKHYLQTEVSAPLNREEGSEVLIYEQQQKKKVETEARELIDFSTFNKHLYLRDNDFLYAKRMGGPVDFVLCTFQEISKSTSKKKQLFSRKTSRSTVEYITISKNTILHYQKGDPSVYSIFDWTENFIKYKRLMSIPLFKNFKTNKLFDLWRKFYKKSTRNYYSEKLKKKFQLIDEHLLRGLREIRRIMKQMENERVFAFEVGEAVFLQKFKDVHQRQLGDLDKKIEVYRQKVKKELSKACAYSYLAYKDQKKITLDDNITPNQEDNDGEGKKETDQKGSTDTNVQTFLKDAIPYAQDATRKTHYKKLLRYIRVVDFIFNESKFDLISSALIQLNLKFERLYSAYVHKWSDTPLIIISLFTLQGEIKYNPSAFALTDVIFDQFIQEKIYAIIYKKNFIDPQEFPNYMTCFEEVFETSVDQNANLNARIKEDSGISKTFSEIKANYELCIKSMDDYSLSLKPVLTNHNEYNAIDFAALEESATPGQLKDLLEKFLIEQKVIKELKSTVNIGLFEFHLGNLLEMVVEAPKRLLEKIRNVIPQVTVVKLKRGIKTLKGFLKNLNIQVNEVDSFIKLKQSVEECAKERINVEDMMNEITDLLMIISNDKLIKLEDYDTKLITEIKNTNVEFERKYDSMTYFIDNNIKKYRIDLKVEIKKYDTQIKEMLTELNDEKINKYNDDAMIPIIYLENKELQINQAIERKKVYQKQEESLDMEDHERSNFENLDNLTNEYDLKLKLWASIREFGKLSRDWEQSQIMRIKVDSMESQINEWLDLCKVAMVDLDFPYVPQGLQERIVVYEKLIPLIITIQNENIKSSEVLTFILKSEELLNTSLELTDPTLTLEKIMEMPHINDKIPAFVQLNTRANEEQKIKGLIKAIKESFEARRLPLRIKINPNQNDKNEKYVIYKVDFENEYDYVEDKLLILNKLLLNPYFEVVGKEVRTLRLDIIKYKAFIEEFYSYQVYYNKSEGIVFNGEFAKEMPLEFKKIANESLLKSLFKILKEYNNAYRFTTHAYDKVNPILHSLIQAYEANYKSISAYLDKKRREYPKLYLLSDENLVELYENKESNEIKLKLLQKVFPWIKNANLGNENDEQIQFTTVEDEVLTFKSTKRTFKDNIDTIEANLPKKLKDSLKLFKREYEASLRPKSEKRPKEVMNEFITSKDAKETLAQAIFNCMYCVMFDLIDKALYIDDEAFDKLFDLYHESKNERRENYIKQAKSPDTPLMMRKIYINLISLENYFISIVETLIREDVSKTSDFNYQKLISARLENENIIFKLFSFTFEYGFEYVGLQSNFCVLPQTERMTLALVNSLTARKPFTLYGRSQCGKKETLNQFANLMGKHINYFICTEYFNASSLNMILFSNFKNGGWICLDRADQIGQEAFSILASRILDVYRIIREGEEDGIFHEGNEKFVVNVKMLNVFLIYNLPYAPSASYEISIVIREYFRIFSFSTLNYTAFLELSLNNLALIHGKALARKVMFLIQMINSKVSYFKHGKIKYSLLIRLIKKMIEKDYHLITPDNEHVYVRNAFMECIEHFLSEQDVNQLNRVINHVFAIEETQLGEKELKEKDKNQTIMKGNEDNDESENEEEEGKKKELSIQVREDEEDDEEELEEILASDLKKYHFGSNQFSLKAKAFFKTLNTHKSFLLCGPPMSGKSTLISIIQSLCCNMHNVNSDKYFKMQTVKVFPKENKAENIFALNKQEIAYQLNNNYFHNILNLFSPENKSQLSRINEKYAKALNASMKREISSPSMSPRKARGQIATHDSSEEIFELVEASKAETKEKCFNTIVFDGQIDQTWINYITSIHDIYSNFSFANGEMQKLEDFKFIFETTNIKHVSPDFIVKQCMVYLDNECFSWENMLYAFLDSNEKLNENADLKNHVRGLLENYFPKIWDFIQNNKLKYINFNETYAMKNLINVFSSVLPKFNFEDKKIGKRNINVVPKIEIIKKRALSIFIFSCAWTILPLTNFIIKTKIEKLISDIFKADDLKGPIFDYYIDEVSNDFEKWEVLIGANPQYQPGLRDDSQGPVVYSSLFIPTVDNVPVMWIGEKFLKENVSFYFSGKPCIGKSKVLNAFLDDTSKTAELNNVKYLLSNNVSRTSMEKFLFGYIRNIKRDIIGDEFSRKVTFFIDDVHLTQRDRYDVAEIEEYLRQINENKSVYDQKANQMKYFDNMIVICCGNISEYPPNDNSDRFISKMSLLMMNVSEDSLVSIYKEALEKHLAKIIPSTAGITSTQYIQASMRLNEMLKKEMLKSPKRLHLSFSLSDVTRVIQAFHEFVYKGSSDYPEYLKKLFFYENVRIYEDRLNKVDDVKLFRTKICEAYSSVFKQDRVSESSVFSNWDKPSHYVFALDYQGESNAHVFYKTKEELYAIIKAKQQEYITQTQNVVVLTEKHLDHIIKILRALNREDSHLILLGKPFSEKESLFFFSAFIHQAEIMELDPYFVEKNQEDLISSVITNLLVTASYMNKRVVLYLKSKAMESPAILEMINNLINTQSVLKLFSFIDEKKYGSLSNDEIIARLRANLSICLSVLPKTDVYRNIFVSYPFIAKKCIIIYKHSWKDLDLTSYSDECLRELKEEKVTANSKAFGEALTSIHFKAIELSEEYSKRLRLHIRVTSNHYVQMCQFYCEKYGKYLSTLKEKQMKYTAACEVVDRCKAVIGKVTDEIKEIEPLRDENEKVINSKKEEIAARTLERNQWKIKKLEEEKPLTNFENYKLEKDNLLRDILNPFKDKIEKSSRHLRDLNEKELIDVKNAWENFTFGKMILSRVYELIGESSSEWDYIKKSITPKVLQRFLVLKISEVPADFLKVTRDIIESPEYGLDEKYQKAFKICAYFCEYFNTCNNYFNEYHNQSALLEDIENVKKSITEKQKILNDIKNKEKDINKAIETLESDKNKCDKQKNIFQGQLEKKNSLISVCTEFLNTTKEKIAYWKGKKDTIDTIISNLPFYLLFISAYVTYAPPLNQSSRKQLEAFIYSKKKEANYSKAKEMTLIEVMRECLDNVGKDKELFFSIYQFDQFYQENFLIIYLYPKKVPYIIDYDRACLEPITQFLQLKELQSVITTSHNESSDMYEKVDSAMKNGSALLMDLCQSSIFSIMKNIILNNYSFGDKGRKVVVIDNKKFEFSDKFKLYLIKNKISSKIDSKAWTKTLVINFSNTIQRLQFSIKKSLAMEHDVALYNSLSKFQLEMQKDKFRLAEMEEKMYLSISQFDYSGNVDKYQANQSIYDKYRLEVQAHSLAINNIETNKKRVIEINMDLERYKQLATDSSKIYKIIKGFSMMDDAVNCSLGLFIRIVKTFFKEKYVKETQAVPTTQAEDTHPNEDNQEMNQLSDSKSQNEGEENEEEPKKELNEERPVVSTSMRKMPTYQPEHLIDYILHLFDKYLPVYDYNQRNPFLLTLLIFYLKERANQQYSFKALIANVNSVYFQGQSDKTTYDKSSPIASIAKDQWNALLEINHTNDDLFSSILNSIEQNSSQWEEYLSEDMSNSLKPSHYSHQLKLPFEAVESSMNPLFKFIFFSIIKPHRPYYIIQSTISAVTNRDNFIIPTTPLYQLIMAKQSKPILLIETDNLYEMELRDFYFPELFDASVSELKYKELTLKGEILSNEIEGLVQLMKNGSMIVIRNIHLAKETYNKLATAYMENRVSIPETFKLIFITRKGEVLPSGIYSLCNVLNLQQSLFTNMKDYIVNILIPKIPKELISQLLNKKSNTVYARKMMITFILVQSILIQYPFHNVGVYDVPIRFRSKDLVSALTYINTFLLSIPEDKESQYSNLDNDIGFNYLSIITNVIDMFFIGRLIWQEDVTRVQKIIMTFFDEEAFFNEEYYFSYQSSPSSLSATGLSFEIACDKSKTDMTKQDLSEVFERIDDDKYYLLLHNISTELINKQMVNSLSHTYSLMASAFEGDELPKMNHLKHINIKQIDKTLNDIKGTLPEPINLAGDGVPLSLFKINKQGDYVNPLDASLLNQVTVINEYIKTVSYETTNLIQIIQGDMVFIEKYYDIILQLNKNLLPSQWRRKMPFEQGISLKDWKDELKQLMLLMKSWIDQGSLPVYHLNLLENPHMLFYDITYLFNRKHDGLTPDSIKLKFFITDCFNEDDLKKKGEDYRLNHLNDIVYVDGIELVNAAIDLENQLITEGTTEHYACPIIGVTYSIEDNADQKEIQEENANVPQAHPEEVDDEELRPGQEEQVDDPASRALTIPFYACSRKIAIYNESIGYFNLFASTESKAECCSMKAIYFMIKDY